MICESFDSASRFARPVYYITSVSVCQGVFEKFFENFFKFFSHPLANPAEVFDIISHLFPFVKRFFKSFSTFFVIFCPAVFELLIHPAVLSPAHVRSSLTACCLVDSLHIIALSFSFVKGFFISFFGLEVRALIYKSIDVLCAYCTKSPLFSFFPPLFEGANFLFSSPRAHLVKNPPPQGARDLIFPLRAERYII